MSFQSRLDEYTAKQAAGRRDHPPMPIHFKAVSSGSWDNISWSKDDVGVAARPAKDRHGIMSVYVRFKGAKSSKLVPEPVFRKFFLATKEGEIDPGKWADADKGGTKIDIKKKPNNRKKEQMSASELERAAKKTGVTVNVKKESYNVPMNIFKFGYYQEESGAKIYQIRKYFSESSKSFFVVFESKDKDYSIETFNKLNESSDDGERDYSVKGLLTGAQRARKIAKDKKAYAQRNTWKTMAKVGDIAAKAKQPKPTSEETIEEGSSGLKTLYKNYRKPRQRDDHYSFMAKFDHKKKSTQDRREKGPGKWNDASGRISNAHYLSTTKKDRNPLSYANQLGREGASHNAGAALRKKLAAKKSVKESSHLDREYQKATAKKVRTDKDGTTYYDGKKDAVQHKNQKTDFKKRLLAKRMANYGK